MTIYSKFKKDLETTAFRLLRLHYSLQFPKHYETIAEYLEMDDLPEMLQTLKDEAEELARLRGHLNEKQARQFDVSKIE